MKNTVATSENLNVVHGSFRRSIFSQVLDQIKAWNERRLAVRQLRAMSDRMLRDIGIERHEIELAVERPSVFASLVSSKFSKPEVLEDVRKAA